MLNLSNWLKSGALIYLGDNRYLLGSELLNKLKSQQFETVFYMPNFYLSEPKPWQVYKDNIELSKDDLIALLENFIASNSVLSSSTFEWLEPEQAQFNHSFDKIQNLIENKVLEKLVPIVFEASSFKIDEAFIVERILKLLKTVDGQNIYGHWHQNKGVLGVTPEILFNLKGNKLETMALAGTGLTSEVEDSLLNDEKEKHEHSLVVTNIFDVLSKFGEVSLSETYEWKLNPLKHLRTDIKVNIAKKNISVMDLLQSLHPTAALGVYPKTYDWKKIKNFETEDRMFFGAPFAVSYKNEFKSLVAIRNIQWLQGRVKLGSGCGIVGKSDKVKEWRELNSKRNSVKKYLGLFDG